MTDSEILDHLENLTHVFTLTLTRDWTYELIIRDSVGHENTIKGGSIRECIKKTAKPKQKIASASQVCKKLQQKNDELTKVFLDSFGD